MRANIKRPDGTVIEIDGTPEEVQKVCLVLSPVPLNWNGGVTWNQPVVNPSPYWIGDPYPSTAAGAITLPNLPSTTVTFAGTGTGSVVASGVASGANGNNVVLSSSYSSACAAPTA